MKTTARKRPARSLLVVDMGNTSTTLGLYRRGKISKRARVDVRRASRDMIQSTLQGLGTHALDGCAIASVVPARTRRWRMAVKQTFDFEPMLVDHTLELGIPISYPHPKTIGADRLANAAGAADKYGVPVVVADFGTALTFDIIHATQGYIGGIIAPGLPMMFDYLAERTALLPHIKPRRGRHIVGKSTEQAMQIGAHWGYLGMVRELFRRLRDELGDEVTCCATGGHASWILHGLEEPVTFDRDLTLYGLGRIYELNRD